MRPEDLAALDKEMTKKQQYAAEDRNDSRMFNRVQLLGTYNKLKAAGHTEDEIKNFMGPGYNTVIGSETTKRGANGTTTTTTKVN